jgi:molybdenum cofactor cytidylyltransferase
MGQPKALLPIAGSTFLGQLIGIYTDCCEPVIVVLGHSAAVIRAGVAAEGVQWVVNERPERGQFSSLQCGLRALPAGMDCLFQPIDYPAVSRETVALLAGTVGELVIPRHDGERGHPVRLSPLIIGELLALPAEAQARDVIRAHYPAATFVDVADAGVVTDIDTPEDFARWIA